MTKAKLGSIGLSLFLFIALIVWMATGDVKVAEKEAPAARETTEETLPAVQVEQRQSRLYQPGLLLQGQIEPWQSVSISARVPGTVESLNVGLGDQVEAGQVMARLSEDGRQTAVTRWQTRLRKLEADLAAARRLRERELTSESEILTLQSELATARAELAEAQLVIDHLTPEAPFDGVVNHKSVDQGDLVQVGSPMFELVQIDRLKAVGQVPQQNVSRVAPGQSVNIETLDGETLNGEVRFVASAANRETRSFAVEISVDNPERKKVAGGSATLRIALPEVQAMFISPAYLSLGDDGRPGVRHVNDDNQVVFTTVRLLSITTDGAWVAGLPPEIRLITRGAGFVALGQQVRPVFPEDERG
ncbi:efflux RND transporter periplasmic adaptor subunit [Marinobacter confluentis]|uniref:Efflux RND transporter periplasmic adaptor subunit n=1 Tax=Marinobacter confluentis TaxID=1697557 RepID=A0A4Z1C460_9GAMM|nr:efflux RND transporter periplasmic adaptor subunit [Marinobacter confluentis]TGN41141.1 efflux RND transporter periplasmic adaptor subunit [Marinobacter confluentis]